MTLTPNVQPTAAAASSAEVVIKCAGLNKTFKDFWLRPRVKAVIDVNFEVRKGEVFGLLGPNGSGKSTTIKLILGLLHPTTGRVAVFNKRPEDVATKELIGYLPEESYLYRFLNARETLDYYGRLFHLPRHVRQKRIDMLLEMVGLDAAQHRPVGEYSKGMQRRIGLAQALINQPQLLILDEPTTGMDPVGSRQMKDLILRLKERGITILLCSHLLADVEDVCDRVTIMFGGRVVEEGTIDDLLTQHDITAIEAAHVDDETVQQIEQVLARRGKHIERVTHRRQTLEQKFLELVERERSKGSVTSGAQSGGRIAGFLLDEEGGTSPVDAEGAAVIDQLTRSEPAPTPKASAEPAAGADVAEPAEDVSLLSQLSGEKAADAGASTDAVAASPASPAEPEADLSVLAGLVVTQPGPEKPKQSPEAVKAPAKETAKDMTKHPGKDSSVSVAPSSAKPAMSKPEASGPEATAPRVEVSPPQAQSKPSEPARADVPQPQTPMATEPAKPQVSKESGESGLGLLSGVTSEDDDFELPPIDPPKPPRPQSKTGEKPDAGFLKALEDVESEEEQ